jgi:hypothetical protein
MKNLFNCTSDKLAPAGGVSPFTMKRNIIIFFYLLFIPLSLFSQNIEDWVINTTDNDTVMIEPWENYIINYRFDSTVYTNKCPCILNYEEKKCILVKGQVIDVIYIPPWNKDILSKNELLKISYIMIPEGKLIFNKGQNLLISAYSTTGKKYLVYYRTREPIENKNYTHIGGVMYIPGDCFKRFLFIKKNNDKFTKFILHPSAH